jgi:hypothetical protein
LHDHAFFGSTAESTSSLCSEAAARIQELERELRSRSVTRSWHTHRQRNYWLRDAVDLTKLSIACEKLIEHGAPSKYVHHFQKAIQEALDMLRLQNPQDEDQGLRDRLYERHAGIDPI